MDGAMREASAVDLHAEMRGVTRVYPGGIHALAATGLRLRRGEFYSVIGPSGCGKSTLLRMLAGLEEITGGTIAIDGRVVNDVESKDRDIAMVFQSYALYPHLSAFDNMAVPLRMRRLSTVERLPLLGALLPNRRREERSIRSVANATRQDAREFLRIAAEIPVRTEIETFRLEDANQALQGVKRSAIRGAIVSSLRGPRPETRDERPVLSPESYPLNPESCPSPTPLRR